MAEQMPPMMAARLLRAKAAELEYRAKVMLAAPGPDPELWVLTADVGLVAGLLAELIERVERGGGAGVEVREEA